MHARTQSCTQARTHARKHARKHRSTHTRTYRFGPGSGQGRKLETLALSSIHLTLSAEALPNERWNSTCQNVSYLNADLGYSASSAFKVVTPTYRLTRGGLRKRMCLASRSRKEWPDTQICVCAVALQKAVVQHRPLLRTQMADFQSQQEEPRPDERCNLRSYRTTSHYVHCFTAGGCLRPS
ncbi:hypothetical protein EVAR_32221_1 [Eumeta japonica]|uniref:Uncharacterized protein n=1 Tax=Eumeta variegata TaxID=151549 RepID=A0A4C1YLK0_EUMVA|nr:hypothetical protein EVAR_32221_1 [Eumeta japonica]